MAPYFLQMCILISTIVIFRHYFNIHVTNTRMYLPQVHWGVYQTLIRYQLAIYWVKECGISMPYEYINGVYLQNREEPLV